MFDATPKRRTTFTPREGNRSSLTINTNSTKGRMTEGVSSPTSSLKESPIRSNSYYKTPKRRSSSTTKRQSVIMDDEREADDFAKFLSPTGEKFYRKLSEEAEMQQPQTIDTEEDEVDFKEFQKLLEKSKLNVERGEDDDSVRLLRQQLTQVQQIKYENQKKQKLINDLQRQVDDLLQARDEGIQLRNEINILRERVRAKDEELKRLEIESNDRITTQKGVEKQLRDELLQLQQVLTEEKTKRDAESSQFKKEIEQAREEVAISEMKRGELEKELADLSISLKEQQELQDKRNKGQKELAEKLQEQIEILLNTRSELTDKLNEADNKLKKSQKSIEDRDLEIDKLKRKIDRLEQEKHEQNITLNQLQNNIINLQDKVSELHVEENLVEELKKDLSIIPELRNEITSTRKKLEETQNQLDKENHSKQLVTEELRKMSEINDNLELYIADLKDENDSLKDKIDELSKVRAENDFLQRELSHYKETTERLTEQYNATVQQRDLKESEINSAHGALASEFYALMKTIEHVMEGHEYNRTEDDTQISKKGIESVKPNYKGLRTKVMDCLDELILSRDKNRILQEELDGLSNNFQNLNHDHSDTYKELINLKKQLSDSEKVCRALKEQKQELEDSVNELEELLDNHQEEEKNRLRFVYSLYKLLKETPTNDKRNGSPLRGRSQPAESDEPISWETFQSLFSEQVTTHLVERESLKKEVASQKEKLNDQAQKLEEAFKTIKSITEKYEAEKNELQKKSQNDLDEQRNKFEHQIEMLEIDYSEKIKELEDTLRELQEQFSETSGKLKKSTMIVEVLKTELRDSQLEQGKLHAALKLVARGLRPMKNRIDDLKMHKSVLKSQLKQYERLLRGVYETVKSLSNEFEIIHEFEFPKEFSTEKTKTSFRAAVIAVIIGNRFNKMLKEKREEKESNTLYYTVGGDKLALLSADAINDNKDFQISNDEYKGAVHTYLQLVNHLDPQFEEEKEDFSMIRSLQDGLSSSINRHIITGYRFNASEALSTPIKKQAKSIVHQSPQKRGLSVVQQTTIGVVKALRELKAEKTSLQKKTMQLTEEVERLSKKVEETEEIIKKKSDLISFMENRINDLEEENLNLVEPEKYELIKKEVEKLRSNYTTVQFEKEQFKQEFESQLSQLNQYRSDLQELQDQLAEKSQKLDSALRELDLKREECNKLFNTSKKTTEMLSELEKEKSKYENMVSDLRQKLFKKPGKDNSIFSDSEPVSSSSSTTATPSTSKYISSATKSSASSSVQSLKTEETPKPSSAYSSQKSTPSSSFGSVKKKVERDLSASHKIMKTLNESNAKTSREVQELDKELKNARAHLAELQNSLSLSGSSPARKMTSPGRKRGMTVEEILNRSNEFDYDQYEEMTSSSRSKKYSQY
ncbi:hypothetical protein FDP41_003429 [Naegleria fowleri]|uniref:Uncharacterized protein n=1 Tax=Naegleria fowleri TaxID=5763 RepID=A0A6A5BKA6_NAEFO|nr:uncharacterized protein FDP41_003429 [Naegleria fowleri]KAF0977437.1 hypothetical protein FDP41_003429 [Naegleria fowleri]